MTVILNVYNKYNKIIKSVFGGNQLFITALNEVRLLTSFNINDY